MINEIVERIKLLLNIKSDADVGRALLGDVENPSQAVSAWRKRGTIPWQELYNFAQKNNVSLDFIINGKCMTTEKIIHHVYFS